MSDDPSNGVPEDEGSPSFDEGLAAAAEAAFAEDVPEVTEKVTDDKPRNEKGQFASKTNKPEEREEPETPDIETPEPSDTPEAKEPEAAAPVSWTAEEKALFAKLPPDLRQTVARRESEREKAFTAKMQETAEHRKVAESFLEVAQPYMPMIKAEGGDAVTAFSSLLNAAYQLRQNPAATLQQLAQQFGVDLGQLQRSNPSQYEDPQLQGLAGELQSLKNALYQSQMQQQQAYQEYEQRTHQEITKKAQQELAAFEAEQRPYFDQLKPRMAELLRSGVASDLKAAYETAVWENPELRQQQIQNEVQSAKQKALDEAKQKAAQAKAKAGTVLQTRGAPEFVSKPGSLDETLSAAYDQVVNG